MKPPAAEALIPLGITIKPWGKVAAVGWVGERYYWFVDRFGDVSMIPATEVERVTQGENP